MTTAPPDPGSPELSACGHRVLRQLLVEVFKHKTLPNTLRVFELENMAHRISEAATAPIDPEPPF